MCGPAQIVVDVSINWDEEKPNARGGKGAIAGDAVFEEVEPWWTPSPRCPAAWAP